MKRDFNATLMLYNRACREALALQAALLSCVYMKDPCGVIACIIVIETAVHRTHNWASVLVKVRYNNSLSHVPLAIIDVLHELSWLIVCTQSLRLHDCVNQNVNSVELLYYVTAGFIMDDSVTRIIMAKEDSMSIMKATNIYRQLHVLCLFACSIYMWRPLTKICIIR